MRDDFKKLFSIHPFLQFFCTSRYGLIKLDRNGIICACFNLDSHLYPELLDAMIGRPIQDFYNIGSIQGAFENFCLILDPKNALWNNPRSAHHYLSKTTTDKLVLPADHHSLDSQGSAIFFNIEGELFAVLTFHNAIPAISIKGPVPAAITDTNGRLVSCNDALLSIFIPSGNPEEILGKKLSSFTRFIYKTKPPAEKHPIKPLLTVLTELFPEVPSSGNALALKNVSQNLQMVALPLFIKHDCQDYTLSVTLTNLKGSPPLFLLRTPFSKPSDDSGYLMGATPDNRLVALKKNCVTVTRTHLPPFPSHKPLVITVKVQNGNRFRYFHNGKLLLSYFDPFGFGSLLTDFGVGLAIRLGTSFDLTHFEVEASDPYPQKDNQLLVRFKNQPSSVFQYRQTHTSWSGEIRHVWHFEDITDFEKEIEQLQEEKAQADREKMKLEWAMSAHKQLQQLTGKSTVVERLRENITLLARHARTLLLVGETGTGKEIMARLFHDLSPRALGPFVKLDCSSIPSSLIESELFGYEKGAFTGAHRSHAGKFEQAQGGTLFLDEIANITPETQAKLLGVLEDFRIIRLGGRTPVQLNVHVVAASNRPLELLLPNRIFREDLYYRLNRFKLVLPTLQERMQDIPSLCQQFISEANELYGKSVKRISEEGYFHLYEHHWPGNIRELKNMIYRAVLFCKEDLISRDLLDTGMFALNPPGAVSITQTSGRKRTRLTRELLLSLLKQHEGNIAALASSLGLSRMTVYERAKKYGIPLSDHRIKPKGKDAR